MHSLPPPREMQIAIGQILMRNKCAKNFGFGQVNKIVWLPKNLQY